MSNARITAFVTTFLCANALVFGSVVHGLDARNKAVRNSCDGSVNTIIYGKNQLGQTALCVSRVQVFGPRFISNQD